MIKAQERSLKLSTELGRLRGRIGSLIEIDIARRDLAAERAQMFEEWAMAYEAEATVNAEYIEVLHGLLEPTANDGESNV